MWVHGGGFADRSVERGLEGFTFFLDAREGDDAVAFRFGHGGGGGWVGVGEGEGVVGRGRVEGAIVVLVIVSWCAVIARQGSFTIRD